MFEKPRFSNFARCFPLFRQLSLPVFYGGFSSGRPVHISSDNSIGQFRPQPARSVLALECFWPLRSDSPPRLVFFLLGFWDDVLRRHRCLGGVKQDPPFARLLVTVLHDIGPMPRDGPHVRPAGSFDSSFDRVVASRDPALQVSPRTCLNLHIHLGLEIDIAVIVCRSTFDGRQLTELQSHLAEKDSSRVRVGHLP